MFDEDLLRKSGEEIPEMNPNLESIILERCEELSIKKKRNINLKRKLIPILSFSLAIMITASIIVIEGSKKKSGLRKEANHGVTTNVLVEHGLVTGVIAGEGMYKKHSMIDEYFCDAEISPESKISGKDIGGFIPEGECSGNEANIQAHQLSASAIFDTDNFDFWQSLFDTDGIFKSYYEEYLFKARYRFKVTLPKGTSARLVLRDNNQNVVYSTYADVNGVSYLYVEDNTKEYNLEISYNKTDAKNIKFNTVISGDKDYSNDVAFLNAINNHKNIIDLMFVIDATGSMSDELEYITAEVKDVVENLKKDDDSLTINISFLYYKDATDDYIVEYSDFNQDVDLQKEYASKHHAGGGGDFEEAVQTAFSEALKRGWSQDESTKIIVHLADAPAHDDDIESLKNSVLAMADRGIKVISVASSGIDKKTEYFMRSTSLLTGGVYTHITNDSGIGGGHIDATTSEDETVEYLNTLLIRLILGLHNGEFEDPEMFVKGQ